MFGYIAPDQGRLTDLQKKRYRGFYCGLCHSLLSRYGQAGRLSLSNDMTFLAILLCSMYSPPDSENTSRCAVHPFRKHSFLRSDWIDFAADMNVLLFWLKCRDQQLDDCNLSGEMLGACFVPKPDDMWASGLRAVGEGLGRFVYWMDAWEDYDQDIRAGRFNPLKQYHDREDYDEFARNTLELLIADATEAFEILPLEEDLDLLRNILYSGAWQRYMLIENKRKRKEDARGE